MNGHKKNVNVWFLFLNGLLKEDKKQNPENYPNPKEENHSDIAN